jgi:2-polyprenyl-3-methyl-5-hydroxy-6-metoxy-1,4-benzoquinol methylase
MTDEQDGSPVEPVVLQAADGADNIGNGSPAAKSAFVYATDIDLDNLNDSHTLVVRMVGENRKVLELGCAEGSTTRVLRERGCRVTGIEMDPTAAQTAAEFAERVIVDNLDTMDFEAALGRERFDVIVAADVLEHLSDPVRCLRACVPFLSADGEVVLSIPNVAHADVRLALLDGQFEYSEWGLLDNTHLRFFTRESLLDFLDDCGLAELEIRRVTRPIGGTEIAPALDRYPSLVEKLALDLESQTYQFVLRAAAYRHDSHFATVARDRARLQRSEEKMEQYQAAHARLMQLACPDVLDVDTVGRSGVQTSDAIRELLRSIQHLFEEHELQQQDREEVEALKGELRTTREALEYVQQSESLRVGLLALSPYFATRRWAVRIREAWQRSKV